MEENKNSVVILAVSIELPPPIETIKSQFSLLNNSIPLTISSNLGFAVKSLNNA